MKMEQHLKTHKKGFHIGSSLPQIPVSNWDQNSVIFET